MLTLFSQFSFAEDASAIFRQQIKPSIIELSHDITVFHWTKKSFTSAAEIENYLKKSISKSSSKTNNSGDQVGPGLYLALDPKSTKSFGDNLITIRLKKGTRIMDIREKVLMLPEQRARLSLDKPIYFQDPFISGGVDSMDTFFLERFTSRKVYKIIQDTFSKENISMIVYSYASLTADFCQKETQKTLPATFNEASFAFLVTNKSAIDFNNISYFYNNSNLSNTPSENLIRIENLWERLVNIDPEAENYATPYPFNKTEKPIKSLESWTRKETLICSPLAKIN